MALLLFSVTWSVQVRHFLQYCHNLKPLLVAALLMLLLASSVTAQDRPKGNKRQIQTTRAKSVKKSTKATTKDIAGKRLRTKNTSSAGRAVYSISSSNTYRKKSPGERQRAWTGGRDGQALRIRSATAQQSRNNVFPQKGRFVNASTRSASRPYNNRQQLAKAARMQRGPISYPPGRKRINNQSASRAYVTRGRKNVYWGKFSKGERAYTTDLAGQPLRRRNFQSPDKGLIAQPGTYRGRKRAGDRPYQGSYPSGYSSRTRSTQAWKGDVAGMRIRKPGQGKSIELAGERSLRKRINATARPGTDPVSVKAPGAPTQAIGKFFSGSFKGIKPKKQSGINATKQSSRLKLKTSGKVTTTPVPVKAPGPPTAEIQRFFSGPFKGVKPKSKSGARAAKESQKRGQRLSGKISGPIPVKPPGKQTAEIKRFFGKPFKGISPDQARDFGDQGLSYSGNVRVPRGGRAKEYGGQGLNFSGNMKTKRQPKGGGSVARNQWNNRNTPVAGKPPSISSIRMGRYQGNVRSTGRAREFGDQGLNYSGSIKIPRGSKGKEYGDQGLNYSGSIRIPKGTRGKEYGDQGLSYSGNLRARQPEKGGGSLARNQWNNQNTPVAGRPPSPTTVRMGRYSGNLRSRQPEKGGGSLARNQWNNRNTPIAGRVPTMNTMRMGRYSGNIRSTGKAREFSDQGLSYSGNIRRGPKTFSAEWAGYQGNLKLKVKTFSAEWAGYQGDIRRGKKTFSAEWAGYQGDLRQRGKKVYSREGFDFAGNVRAKPPEKGGGSISGQLWNNNEKAIAGKPPTPEETRALTSSGNIRQSRFKKEYVQNPNADRESLKKKKPTEQDYQVDGLQVKVKERDYARNPRSSKEALLGLKPNSSYTKVGKIPASVRFKKDYDHNKLANKEALDGTAPSKSSVRASEYARSMKQYWDTRHNPSSAKAALDVRVAGRSFRGATEFSGKTRLKGNYRHSPNGDQDALKVIAPSKAYARIGDYQGNVKMKKHSLRDSHPDGQYAESRQDNVKSERTLMMNVKLFFSKVFRKNAVQPNVVKEPVRKPKYDKRERELWKDLYH